MYNRQAVALRAGVRQTLLALGVKKGITGHAL
jgi:hypothetical protein